MKKSNYTTCSDSVPHLTLENIKKAILKVEKHPPLLAKIEVGDLNLLKSFILKKETSPTSAAFYSGIPVFLDSTLEANQVRLLDKTGKVLQSYNINIKRTP